MPSNPPATADSVPGPDDVDLLDRVADAIGPRYRIEGRVASSPDRVLFLASDRTLQRRVSLRVLVGASESARRWFLLEAEALAQLDHPAIRHVYDVGSTGELAWRVGNWVEGEGLDEAVRRSPRPIPSVHVLARALLGALEHAHSRGIIVRRILPSSMIIGPSGRGTLTDLRHSSHTLEHIPAHEIARGAAFMAPEIRRGAPGDPAADVYAAGAILYFAITGQEPALELSEYVPPTQVRSTVPAIFDRLLVRALQPDPWKRYITAWEMYEDFTSEAGDVASQATFIGPPQPAGPAEAGPAWEKRLRRALGDDYELLSEVGRGGFGRVYRARDLHLERVVALKVLEPVLTTEPAAVERFRREAQLAARLRHSNVVDIYDIGGRYGLLWYTMELVEGPNLAQLIEREGPRPLEQVLRLLREGLSALAHAHAAGLVHRDIKPENMLLEPSGALKITDFGLALALRWMGRFGGATSQSGTPQFASPEQLLGEKVDQRTDLYSLAAVGYFVLLGRPPFSGRNVTEILARQTTNTVPDLLAERPDIGPGMARALERAVRADPEARYASASEFLAALIHADEMSLEGNRGFWSDMAGRLLQRGFEPSA
ncbi:MAG TPA: serine/threonine-protein kinase [Gemmatimonadales bacterium]